MIAGARVEVAANKRNPMDFVLWKPSLPSEPGWDSPWGYGRPGWHIECSAMSRAFLGETFDIHGGGIDLVFPHHENEIAQSRCAFGHGAMANVWMHNGFLHVEGQKMSKSLGNFVTIRSLLETEVFGGRRWPGEVLRLAMLKTHYRSPIDFTVRGLEEAEATLAGWQRILEGIDCNHDFPAEAILQVSDDLNTPALISWLHGVSNAAHLGDAHAARTLGCSLRAMGFDFSTMGVKPSSADEIKVAGKIADVLQARIAARAAKNWRESDRIRDELMSQGIVLKDHKDGTTTWETKR